MERSSGATQDLEVRSEQGRLDSVVLYIISLLVSVRLCITLETITEGEKNE